MHVKTRRCPIVSLSTLLSHRCPFLRGVTHPLLSDFMDQTCWSYLPKNVEQTSKLPILAARRCDLFLHTYIGMYTHLVSGTQGCTASSCPALTFSNKKTSKSLQYHLGFRFSARVACGIKTHSRGEEMHCVLAWPPPGPTTTAGDTAAILFLLTVLADAGYSKTNTEFPRLLHHLSTAELVSNVTTLLNACVPGGVQPYVRQKGMYVHI